jgi:hypothetical protein
MHKNKTIFYTLIVIMILSVFALPATLLAQDEAPAAGEEAPEPPKPFKPGFFSMDYSFWGMFEQIIPLFLNFFFPVVLLSSLIKIRLIKRKLNFPWKILEKVSISTMAESIIEVLVLMMTIFFFKPAFSQILNFLGHSPVASWNGEAVNFILHTVMSIPWYCLLGIPLILVLLNFLVPRNLEDWKKESGYAALLTAITPATLVVYLFVSRFIFKWYLY